MGNTVKTALLLGLLTGLLLVIGDALGGSQGLVLALAVAGAMNFIGYFFSDKIALAMHRAQPVSEAEAPELYAVVAELAQRAQIPVPRLYIIPEMQPNAFATGRSPRHAAVAVTEGLLRTMNRAELAGVLAHELAHVKNRDILTASVAATLAGAITVLARMVGYALMFGQRDREEGGGSWGGLFLLIVAPIAALLIQLAISRSREFAADERAARLTGNPLGLASALRKLAGLTERVPMETAQPATASLMIANPFAGGGLMRLFSTHPPIEARIARLEAMVGRL
ncbi:MAG: zinc metalloprotease HtpX [Thermoanaerobaculum sp.]|nr:zinc metalloprotease HtpX [Thermoanaerobaculum sp.]MCX7895436.1 zinc metalloprotease HtpX [Thermoanaerobaculum sp.]MDW7967093.1 zinc metalloprotease HtpX [Thermoanaerobaculum sp.]